MLKTRIGNFERDIDLLINAALSPEAQAELFRNAAREIIAETDAANDAALGRDVQFETFVDGREDEALSSVKIGSRVVAVWDVQTTVLAEVMGLLRANAPVLKGRFRDTLLMLADGQPADPENPPQADEFVFVSPQPYARKLDRFKAWESKSGTMEGVATMASRRYGNVAKIRFGYRSLQGGAIGAWAATTSLRSQNGNTRNRPSDKRSEWLTRQPAIIVVMR